MAGEEQDNAGNVVRLADRFPKQEVSRLNRVTGLDFQEHPESLLNDQEEWEAFAETLMGRALYFWNPGDR